MVELDAAAKVSPHKLLSVPRNISTACTAHCAQYVESGDLFKNKNKQNMNCFCLQYTALCTVESGDLFKNKI